VNALRKLVLGETWTVPAGVAAVLVVGLLLRGHEWWVHAGGFVLLAGVVATLFASVRRVP
jgi:hypothetical protein